MAQVVARSVDPLEGAAEPDRPQLSAARYYAFLSYSHRDRELAEWLHNELEEFRVPSTLAGRLTGNGVVPRRLAPIFRDEQELAAASDLGVEIRSALTASQFLIVLCSPDAAQSHWTNAEIDTFKKSRPDGCVLAVIAAGEPFASDIPSRAAEECFPPALRQRYDRRGRPTGKRAEPLAADLRGGADERRMGFLKLVAGMLGVGLDDLVQRENTRRSRRLAWLTAASLAGMAITSTLAFTAVRARDEARDQRREAEGLVAFMLGDLKDKLEPIGRLDALDGVGARVLDYYRRQNTADLPDNALIQRAQALGLSAQVAFLRGDLGAAQRLYSEAEEGTAEAIARDPSDPQRLFDHAQNVAALGEIDRQQGRIAAAEKSAREYQQLADKMNRLEPNNIRWRMEQEYAQANLAILLYEQRDFAGAEPYFQAALRTIEALAAADPGKRDYQMSLADVLAWLADCTMALGRTDQAIAYRQRNLALLQRLGGDRGDQDFLIRLVPAHRALGNLYALSGEKQKAVEELRQAAANAETLIAAEPDNHRGVEYAANAYLNLADVLLEQGRVHDVLAAIDRGCSLARDLVSQNRPSMQFKASLRTCLIVRADRAARAHDPSATAIAKAAVDLAGAVHTSDPTADRFALAKAYRLAGDAALASGQRDLAQLNWKKAGQALPSIGAERPAEAAERRLIAQRTQAA